MSSPMNLDLLLRGIYVLCFHMVRLDPFSSTGTYQLVFFMFVYFLFFGGPGGNCFFVLFHKNICQKTCLAGVFGDDSEMIFSMQL